MRGEQGRAAARRFRALARQQLRRRSLRASRGNGAAVLLSYNLEPFLRRDRPVDRSHPHHWESVLIATTFLERGFDVDVIDYRNRTFRPRRSYAVLVDSRRNMERLAPRLGPGSLKVMHLDTAHLLFHNAAEYRRLLDCQRRRGVTLSPRRVERPNLGLEHADCGIVLGNAVTAATYEYAGKPLHMVPVAATAEHPSPAGKPVDACRSRWVWMGSAGMVHKGLDLVLEAFAGMPEHHLTVCGPVLDEPDFARAYAAELHRTPNITVLGWVDAAGAAFADLCRASLGLVYPSCSEAGSGSVVSALAGGLIPVVTPETGVDVGPGVGVVLDRTDPASIRSAMRDLAERPTEELEGMALSAWRQARTQHSRARVAERYAEVVDQILDAARDG